MCGITGIIQPQGGALHADTIRQMNHAIAHRGPDGEGVWEETNNTAILGHRRLSIIDLSEAGAQPMHFMDRYVTVHNGEIYNYIELRAELEKNNYRFNSRTDTEVIAAAFDFWGEDCLQQFDGMFAFAIWDRQEKSLFAARDRFGEKPFYYYFKDDCLYFASEMKALFAAGVPRKPNLKLLFNFITIGYTDNPEKPEETFFEEIFKLPAASFLYYQTQNPVCEIIKYWDIDTDKQNKKISDTDAIEKFTALFRQSVQRRLRSDVPIGTSLSGGLDSSSVLAMAMEEGAAISAFTAVFSGYDKDESGYATAMSGHYRLPHFTTEPDAPGLVNDWQKLCHHQEEPFGSASIYAQFKVYEKAAAEGTKVLLDGQGADETLAGYTKYYKWYWQELFRLRKLNRSGELKAARELGLQETFNYKNMIAAYFPDFATIVMERQYLIRALKQEDLSRDFIRFQSREAYYTAPSHFNLNGVLYFNTVTHGLEELLRYADRNAMAFGREVRLPFLSHELVEFIFSLPPNFKIRKGWSKWVLRESMKEKLPENICWRKDKLGFEPPQKSWMENKQIQEMIMQSRKTLVDQGVLKPTVMEKPVNAKDAHEADNFDWRYLTAVVLFK